MQERNNIHCFSSVSQYEFKKEKGGGGMKASAILFVHVRPNKLLKTDSLIKPVNYVDLILPPLVKSEQITRRFGMNVFSWYSGFQNNLESLPIVWLGYANMRILADSSLFSDENIFMCPFYYHFWLNKTWAPGFIAILGETNLELQTHVGILERP